MRRSEASGERPCAFLVPVGDRQLFYAPLHRVGALINEAAARRVRAGGLSELAQLEQLLSATQPAVPGAAQGSVCPSFLGIIPTRGCNIGCVYCNFGGPTANLDTMDPAIAVAAVDWMAARLQASGRTTFQLHFFGGEPFVAPELVDIVVHRVRTVSAQRNLVPYIDASTNGVFNESRCRFIGDYFGGVVLSFDGFKRFHDRNRPANHGGATFEVVERSARRLSEMPLDLCLRVCITSESVIEMEAITRWMCEEFSPSVINFESLTPGTLAARAGLHEPDPIAFARGCVASYRIAADYGVKAVYSAAETGRARLSFCPVGTDALIVSMDGRASACYLLPQDWRSRGIDMDFATVAADGTVAVDFDALTRIRRLLLEKPRCERCFCQWSCAGGCHVNQTFPGCGLEYTSFCLQTRITTACLLLEEMGFAELVDELLADERALRALAHAGNDAVLAGSVGSVSVEETAAPRAGGGRAESLLAQGTAILG